MLGMCVCVRQKNTFLVAAIVHCDLLAITIVNLKPILSGVQETQLQLVIATHFW